MSRYPQPVRASERQAERGEARKLIDQWRTAHRPCLKRLDAQPAIRDSRLTRTEANDG